MPTSISRDSILEALRNVTIDPNRAQFHPRLSGLNPFLSDINQDGLIRGEPEMVHLLSQMSDFSPTAGAEVFLQGPDGRPTRVAIALKALGDLSGDAHLTSLAGGIDFDTSGKPSAPPAGPSAPPAGPMTGPPRGGTPEAMVAAAQKVISDYGKYYGVDQPWVNLDPNHAIPYNRKYMGLCGHWKCNLYGGNVLYLAGFAPPYYGNRGRGEYPNANQFFKWSDRYAAQYGNKVHFQMVSEVDIEHFHGDLDAAVTHALQTARPGDLVMVDHPGSGVADGGHTRVVLRNSIGNGEGSLLCGMAGMDSALAREEPLMAFTGEEHLWVLRPNRRLGT